PREFRTPGPAQRFEILYGDEGRRVITSRDGNPGTTADLLAVSELSPTAQSAAYGIKGGRIVTLIGGTPFDVVVYKVGDEYSAARGSEFGYANYEVQTVPSPPR